MPCRPFSRAAVIFSSGLDTPSPEKKVCVWRSMLKGIGARVVCGEGNGKRRFQGVGARLRSAWARGADGYPTERRPRGGAQRLSFPARRVLLLPDVFP